MRKKLIFCLLLAILTGGRFRALANEEWVTLDVSPGELPVKLYDLLGDDTDALEYLKVTGRCDTLDIRNLSRFKHLRKLDLGSVDIIQRAVPERMCERADSLREVVLPANVTKVGRWAFSMSYLLKKVTFPSESQIEEVGWSAFDNLYELEELYIPNVRRLGGYVFWGCRKFDPSYMRGICSDTYHNFRTCGITEVPEGFFTEDVTDMTNQFQSCDKLKSVYLPNSVTNVSGMCNGCTSLETVHLGNSVREVRSSAFNGTAIKEIDLPASVVRVDANSFGNCPNLKHITCRALLPPIMDRFTVTSNGYFGTTNINGIALTVSKAAQWHYYESQTGWGQLQLTEPIDVEYDYVDLYEAKTLHLYPESENAFKPGMKMLLTHDYNNTGQLLVDGNGTLNLGDITIDRSWGLDHYAAPTNNSQRVCLLNRARNFSTDHASIATWYKQNQWQFLTMPFDVAVKDIELPEFSHIKFCEYDGSERAAGNPLGVWKPVADDAVLTAGKPYALFVINTEENHSSWYDYYEEVKFEAGRDRNCNYLFKCDSAVYPVQEYDAEFAFDRSWNNLGNPYFCYYDIRSLIDQEGNQVTSPVFVWNGSTFKAYSPLDDIYALAPYESFFFQAPAGVTSVKFVPEARYRFDEYVAVSTKAPAKPSARRSVFNFNLMSEDVSVNRARVVINEEASAEYEPGRDAAKFFEGDGAKVYVSGNARYEISERPLGDGATTLGVSAAEAGEYTLHLDGSFVKGWKVTLTDLLTGVQTELTEEDYRFAAEEGNNAERFSVMFSPAREEEEWTVFNLENPGDLNAACETDADLALSVTKLKVIGEMNGYDTNRIKQMKNLVKADLSGARFPDDRVPDSQFRDFQNLEEVILPATVQIIRPNAFGICTKLTRFECPADLYYIDYNAFNGCSSLSEVVFNDKLRVIGGTAFYNTALVDVVLPESLTCIQNEAFNTRESRSLRSIECRSLVPPVYACKGWAEGGQYYGDPYFQSYQQQVQIIVPAAVAESYRRHSGWGEHLIIRTKDMTFNKIVSDRAATIEVTDEIAVSMAADSELQMLGLCSYSDYAGYDWYSGRGQITFEGETPLNFGNVDWRIRHHYNHGASYYEDRPAVPSVINNNPNITAGDMSLTMLCNVRYWHFLSLPFDVRYEDIEIPENCYMAVRTYDGAARAQGDLDNAWVDLKPGDVLKPGVGYAIYLHDSNQSYGLKNIRFKGNKQALNSTMFLTEEQVIDLKDYPSDTESNRSWNFVTNPYAAYYDISCLTDGQGNQLTTPITYRHHNSYRACSPVDDEMILNPNEPIFIQKSAEGRIVFPLEGRMHYDEAAAIPGNPGWMKPGSGNFDRNVFNFDVMHEGDVADRARIVINEAALPTYEAARDASKFVEATSAEPQLYVDGDCKYAICERPLADGNAQLGFAGKAAGSYTLRLTGRHQEGWQVWLTDLDTGTTLDLTAADYDFTLTGNEGARFRVRFDNSGLSGVEAPAVVSDRITVTDITGMLIYEGPRAAFRAPASGVYIISDGVNTNKAFFNK